MSIVVLLFLFVTNVWGSGDDFLARQELLNRMKALRADSSSYAEDVMGINADLRKITGIVFDETIQDLFITHGLYISTDFRPSHSYNKTIESIIADLNNPDTPFDPRGCLAVMRFYAHKKNMVEWTRYTLDYINFMEKNESWPEVFKNSYKIALDSSSFETRRKYCIKVYVAFTALEAKNPVFDWTQAMSPILAACQLTGDEITALKPFYEKYETQLPETIIHQIKIFLGKKGSGAGW